VRWRGQPTQLNANAFWHGCAKYRGRRTNTPHAGFDSTRRRAGASELSCWPLRHHAMLPTGPRHAQPAVCQSRCRPLSGFAISRIRQRLGGHPSSSLALAITWRFPPAWIVANSSADRSAPSVVGVRSTHLCSGNSYIFMPLPSATSDRPAADRSERYRFSRWRA